MEPLLQERQSPYEVELIDFRYPFNPLLFALPLTHSVCRRYERVRPDLLWMVQRDLENQWTAMCVFSCGRNLEKARPSLVVMVKPGAACDWHKLAPTLRLPFNDYVEVEFLPSGPEYLNGGEDGEDPFRIDSPPCSDPEDLPDSPSRGGKVLQLEPYP